MLDILLSVVILLRFDESQLDIVVVELLVHNAVAGCSEQDLRKLDHIRLENEQI